MTRRKWGEVRSDGARFKGYQKREGRLDECWVTAENWENMKAKKLEYQRARRAANPGEAVKRNQQALDKLAPERKKQRLEAINARRKERKEADPVFKLSLSARSRISHSIKKKHMIKCKSSLETIGCSWEYFLIHIEMQFKKGMTWENYGLHSWHIDHKIPLASAKTLEELEKLLHFTNTQPLWAGENRKKSDTMPT